MSYVQVSACHERFQGFGFVKNWAGGSRNINPLIPRYQPQMEKSRNAFICTVMVFFRAFISLDFSKLRCKTRLK